MFNDFDSQKRFASNDPYNYSSNNSRMFKASEFNSTQNAYNYDVQMGLTNKISTLTRNVDAKENSKKLEFLLSRVQDFQRFQDKEFKLEFPASNPQQKIDWVPIREILGEDLNLFPKDPNGVFLKMDPQGINNNALISVMNMLLTRPSLLSRLFETENVTASGIYGVWLCDNGAWSLQLIDDLVPALPSSKYLLNELVCKEKCVFHMILQKALAKLYGGYEGLMRVGTDELLTILTGSHVELKNLQELQTNEDLWASLKKWREANYLVFFTNEDGVSFPLVDCIERIAEQQKDGPWQRILKLKTPLQGETYSHGVFGKNAGLTSEEKTRLKIPTAPSNDDPFFCLAWDECTQFFTELGVCKVQNKINMAYHWITLREAENVVLKFRLDSPGSTVVSVNHRNAGHIRAMLAREEDVAIKAEERLRFVVGDYSNRKVFLEKNELESGEYLLVVEMMWTEGSDKELTVAVSCDNEPSNTDLGFEKRVKKPTEILEIQKVLLKSYAESMESNTMRIRDYSSSGEPTIKIYNDMVLGLSYFYYTNQSNKKLREIITMQTLQNLRICEPYKDSNSFTIELDPNEEAIVVYKYDKNSSNFSYALTIKSSLERANSVISSSQINYENSEIKKSVNKMKSSSIVISSTSDSSSLREDLIKKVMQKGKINRRKVDKKEIDVLVYSCVHHEGLAIVYVNQTQNFFKEVLELQTLENLELTFCETSEKENNRLIITLSPGASELLLFNKIAPEGFSFRFKNQSSMS